MSSFSFKPAEHPSGETDRQQAVDRVRPVARRRQAELQQIVERAARAFGTPMAAVSIIDRNRQRHAAHTSGMADETDRDVAFCAHAIHRPGETMVVEDASRDSRFAGNPFVTGEPGIRFYAGKPIVSREGFALGTLCVIDTEPRETPDNLIELTLLAREVEKVVGG